MAIRITSNKFKCMFCGKIFPKEVDADTHRDRDHNIVYVPFEVQDLERLRKFLYFKDERLLTDSLSKTIISYANKSAKARIIEAEDGV